MFPNPLKNFQIRQGAASRSTLAAFATLLGGALFFSGAGCKSTPPPDPMAEAAESGERPVAMKGGGSFFDGKVGVTVTISRGFARGAGAHAAAAAKNRREHQKDAASGGISDSYPVGSDNASDSEQREYYEELVRLDRARRAAGSPMPPVTIRFSLENHGTEPAEIEILELNSDLGNFAVRPAKVTLTNAQLIEVDPMVSQLGVTSDEIPMKIVLRIGGKKETQVIPVKSIFTAIEKEKAKK